MARGDKQAGKLQKKEPPVHLRDVLLGLALAVALALVGLYGTKLWRRAVPAFASPRSIHRVAYRATLDRIGEAGLVRARGETRERFASRVAARAPSLSRLTREHVGRAFGGRALAPPVEVRRLAGAAAAEARRQAPWWRLVLGWLNPISFFSSR
jgi:hypothetical protein